jgi:glucose/arabinose dehydrogenase
MKKFLFTFLCCFALLLMHAQSVNITPYVSGLTSPIDIRHCNDNRLFVAQRNGFIRVINADGTLRPTPFLDISTKISSTTGEEGFLGFCFAPDYKTSGKFYVNYTSNINSQLTTVIEEYKVSAADTNVADAGTNLTVLTQSQPFSNHNGGNLFFGADGYLYCFLGDGGSGGDPQNNAQNKNVLLGKILRLDVLNVTLANPYAIPATNPFINEAPPVRKEIWAYGVRNPWRNSFDRITNDLWIADVGQDAREEINFQPAGLDSGRNYGWRKMEGVACFNPATNCAEAGMILPIYDYDHSNGRSVTGGNVYRSVQSRDLWGVYLFSDFTGRWIDGLRQVNGVVSSGPTRLLANAGGGPIAFGEDIYGELYLFLNGNGTVYKIEDANANRFPKAYFTTQDPGNGTFVFKALQGRNISYQWLLNDVNIPGATSPAFTATINGEYKLAVTNSLGNTDISAGFALSALPVTLQNLKAGIDNNNSVTISWSTGSETNNKGFYIQRKVLGSNNFADAGFVNSKAVNGTSSQTLQYIFNDGVQLNKTLQYRIKQVELDGKFIYSGTVTIKTTGNNNITITPNPASNFIIINNMADGKFSVTITSLEGRKMIDKNYNGTQQKVAINNLPKGLYIVEVSNKYEGVLHRQKISVQ